MNIRSFSMALLVSALPHLGTAETINSFNERDFISAQKLNAEGEMIFSLKLSKSGKAKLKKLKVESVKT